MTGMLSQTELESLVAAGDIDTVLVAFCDMQGRLTGKRVSARLFVELDTKPDSHLSKTSAVVG